jgi:hypothetical protein
MPNTPQFELTSDSAILKTPQYHKIRGIVDKLKNTNRLMNFAGNCVSTADIMQHLISHAGIPCRIIECQACLIRNDGESQDYVFIGYDDRQYPGQIDTHVVVVTTDENPLLIDMSLAHMLPKDRPYIVERVRKNDDPNVISEFNLENITITYTEKKMIKLPSIHQKNLLDRIMNDQKMNTTIKTLRTFVMCAVGLGLVNFTLNVLLIILRLYNITWVD